MGTVKLPQQALTTRDRTSAVVVVILFSVLWIALSGLFVFIGVTVIFNEAQPMLSSFVIAFVLLYVVVNFEFLSEQGIGAYTLPVRRSKEQLKAAKILLGAALFVVFVAILAAIVMLSRVDGRELFGVQVHPLFDLIAAAMLTFLARVFVWLPLTPQNVSGQDSTRRHRANPPRGVVPKRSEGNVE